jgi:hypothetical protein
VLGRAAAAGLAFVCLDGTLVSTDRVAARAEDRLRCAKDSGLATTDTSTGLTDRTSSQRPENFAGPWNRRPPERLLANRHTQMPFSGPRGISTPTTVTIDKVTKDPG